MCDKGFIWNSSNCECECDKSCDVDEYLDYENCKCRKKLVEECIENVEKVKLAKITLDEDENKYKNKLSMYKMYTYIIKIWKRKWWRSNK